MSTIAAMGDKGYFHFELCLLAFDENDHQKCLETIIAYCLCEQARRIDPEFPIGAGNAALDRAADFLHVGIESHEYTITQWKEANTFIGRWERRHGKDALVRIATTLLGEALKKDGVSYREFSLICAINSIIGKSRSVPKRITEPSIQVRAAGYKSWKVAKQAGLSSDDPRLLTEHQVRYSLRKLHQRRFFARARVGARTVKYMVGVTDDELRAKLLQSETYEPRFRADRAKKDAELMAAIKSAKEQLINVGKNPAAVSFPIQSPHGHDMIPDIVPDINTCSLNNGPLNNGSLNNGSQNIAPPSGEGGVGKSLRTEKPKKLDRSEFTESELAFMDLYHQICLPTGLGFLPVTCRSPELDKVLEVFASDFDVDEWTKNFDEAVECRREVFFTNPCKYNTLVQICWKLNY